MLDFLNSFMSNPILVATLGLFQLLGGEDELWRDDDKSTPLKRNYTRRIAFSDERGLPLSSILGSQKL